MGNKISSCKAPTPSRCCDNDSSDEDTSMWDSDNECCESCCKNFKCCGFKKKQVNVTVPTEEGETDGEELTSAVSAPLRSAPSVDIIGI